MCSSDKQNMDHDIENLLVILNNFRKALKNKGWGLEKMGTEIGNKRKEKKEEIEKKSMELEKLVEDLRGSNGECSEGENCGKAIDYFFQDIRQCRNVVDLSVTGLTEESLLTFWGTLEQFHNLIRLGVAVTDQSVIKLPDSNDIPEKLKKNLKRLRMEGEHLGLEKLGGFEELNHLTLASHKTMDIGRIPNLTKLRCLRLYGVCKNKTCTSGVCKNKTCKFELKLLSKLEKLVIGNMGKVQTVQISSVVLDRVGTLKFSDLPNLKEVKYTEETHSRVTWGNKTIILRNSGDLDVGNRPGLEIYKYNEEKKCYRLKAT